MVSVINIMLVSMASSQMGVVMNECFQCLAIPFKRFYLYICNVFLRLHQGKLLRAFYIRTGKKANRYHYLVKMKSIQLVSTTSIRLVSVEKKKIQLVH